MNPADQSRQMAANNLTSRTRLAHWLLITLFLTLSACVNRPLRSDADQLQVGHELVFDFSEWQRPGFSRDLVQQVSGTHPGGQFSIQTLLSITNERVKIVGLDAMGRRGFELYWGKSGVVSEVASWLPAKLDPRHLLADAVMVYWPADRVQALLSGKDMSVTDSDNERRIALSEQVVVIIDYGDDRRQLWNSTTQLVNRDFGYQLVIQSAEINQ